MRFPRSAKRFRQQTVEIVMSVKPNDAMAVFGCEHIPNMKSPAFEKFGSKTPFLLGAFLAAGLFAGCASEPRRVVVVSQPPPPPPPVAVVEETPVVTGEVVVEAPPPPVREVITVRPSRRHVWVNGYYVRRGGHYVWVSGHWALPPHGHAVYVAPHWEHRGGGYVYIEGVWR